MVANKAALSKQVRRYVEVTTEYGVIRLRSMTARDRAELEGYVVQVGQESAAATFTIKLLQRSICDDNGDLIFTNKPEDLKIIEDMDSAVAATLTEEIQKLNKMGVKGVEEAVKN